MQFVRGSDMSSNIEGFARVHEVAARGFACKLLKNERGIEGEGWCDGSCWIRAEYPEGTTESLTCGRFHVLCKYVLALVSP